LADGPFRVHARRDRVLEDDDAGYREDVVRAKRVEQWPDARRARRAGILGKYWILSFVIEPELVLHVDHERVDLRGVGLGDELGHAPLALRRPPVDVERADD